MKPEVQNHPAQISILRELLFVGESGFAELQKPTGLTSDHFKFHIKSLRDIGLVEKTNNGAYKLTSNGKEYANKLDTDSNKIERQPKCSVILVVEKDIEGKLVYLTQQRLKHPYFGFWGFPGGKIRWGETIMEAAARELYEESKLTANLRYMGVYHEHVTQKESGEFLEDKIFHIIRGTEPRGEMIESFEGGKNCWLSLEETRAQEHRYTSFDIEANVGIGKETFVEATQIYSKDQF